MPIAGRASGCESGGTGRGGLGAAAPAAPAHSTPGVDRQSTGKGRKQSPQGQVDATNGRLVRVIQ